jgi:polar amino acid transport system substrate-binding protein
MTVTREIAMKILRGGLVLGAAIFVTMSAADAQQILKVGYAPFNAPVAYLPGATAANYRALDPKTVSAQGALIDLLNMIAKDAGLQFQYVPVVAGEQVAELNAKEIDLITVSAGGSPESKTTIVFTAPIYNTSEALIVKKGDTTQYKTYEDLRSEVVGAQKGTVSADGLLKSGIFNLVKLYGCRTRTSGK